MLGGIEYSLHEPLFDQSDISYLSDCIKSTYVSSVGPYVTEFEGEVSKITGAKYAIATTNGTAALHLALKVAGVTSGDEVLLPTSTFVASANAIAYLHAYPNFLDTNEINLGIDVEKMSTYLKRITTYKDGHCINKNTGNKISAVMPVHLFGLAGDMNDIIQVAQHYELKVIEDASEALGSTYFQKHLGTIGDIGVLSFNGNKIITTGGGGMILTNNPEYAEMCKHLSTTAKVPGTFASEHDQVGYNYRLPNLNAALGLAQIKKLDGYVNKNRELNRAYGKALYNIDKCSIFTAQTNSTSNYWLQTIRLNVENKNIHKQLVDELTNMRIGCRPLWAPLHLQKPYIGSEQADLSKACELQRQLICLPSGPKVNLGE
jgi:perosamine synthetase